MTFKEGDGAFAVVDVDALWVNSEAKHNHWKGSACKVYAKAGEEWKLISHIGLLDYGQQSLKRKLQSNKPIEGNNNER